MTWIVVLVIVAFGLLYMAVSSEERRQQQITKVRKQ